MGALESLVSSLDRPLHPTPDFPSQVEDPLSGAGTWGWVEDP